MAKRTVSTRPEGEAADATDAAGSAATKATVQRIQVLDDFAVEEIPAEELGLTFRDIPREARPHAFAVMPFGKKKGADGQIIDFNAIYYSLIKPALEDAGFEAFRADEETVSGDILTDMFQELLLADLVIADMSIDNANVFYELGIRHAFRKRGVVHIQAGRAYMPFDIFNVRTIPYHLGADGVPDPAFLEKDKQAIVRVARDTWASDQDTIHSPVFNLLSGLSESDRRALRTPLATGFWREYNEWKQLVTVAQRQKRIGDILLLTDEIGNPLIKEEAVGEAGKALADMGNRELALKQYRAGLALNAKNLEFRRQEAFLLNRLKRVDEAIVKLESLLTDRPNDIEAIGYLGRIYKDMWMDSWRGVEDPEQRLQEAFGAYHWLVKSIHTYLRGYRCDLNHIYSGVNALTLAIILIHLADGFDDKDDPDPEITQIRELLPELQGTLQFALGTVAQDEKSDYWSLVSLAELRVMTTGKVSQVTRTYRKALTAARKNAFFLQSSQAQLEMLKSLNLRIEFVEAGLQAIQDEMRRIQRNEPGQQAAKAAPRGDKTVFLFTGHSVDRSRRAEKRFPAGMESELHEKLEQLLNKLDADSTDLAYTAGASCGSEIMFIESCLERGIEVEVLLPYPEAQYIKQFVSPGGEGWVERFYRIRNHENVHIRLQADYVGEVNAGDNPYERNSRWAMYSSLLKGIDKVRLIAAWDGKSGADLDLDGKIVSNMVAQMRQMGGRIEHLNISKFDYWKENL